MLSQRIRGLGCARSFKKHVIRDVVYTCCKKPGKPAISAPAGRPGRERRSVAQGRDQVGNKSGNKNGEDGLIAMTFFDLNKILGAVLGTWALMAITLWEWKLWADRFARVSAGVPGRA